MKLEDALSFMNLLAGLVLVGALSTFLLATLLFGGPSSRARPWRIVIAAALIIACGLGAWYALQPAGTWVSFALVTCLVVAGLAFLIDRRLHTRKSQRTLSLLPRDYPEEITNTRH